MDSESILEDNGQDVIIDFDEANAEAREERNDERTTDSLVAVVSWDD